MSLEKSHRYESPGDLSEEIERWLADSPLNVYAEGGFERLWRMLKNNATYIAGGFVLYCSLNFLLGLGTSFVYGLQEAITNPVMGELRVKDPHFWIFRGGTVLFILLLSLLGYTLGMDILAGSRRALWFCEIVYVFYVVAYCFVFLTVAYRGTAPNGHPLEHPDLQAYFFGVFFLGLCANTLAIRYPSHTVFNVSKL